jgi:myo-inositol 2-dehydrogenase/D-chiro-inositol 1-dehydrogenase
MATSDVVRFGIIGTGMMGCEHLLNLALFPGARVTAIADPNETSRGWGRALAPGDVHVYADYCELLRAAPVDAVVIATPNSTHFEVLQHVFQTRKHILVEKPLCTEIDHCRRVVDAAAKHPALVWVGMEYRYMRAVAALIAAADVRQVGPLWMLAIREHRLPFLTKVDNWNRFNRNTGGTLVEKCCHFFDLMRLILAQRPVRVYASGAQNVNHLDERYGGETPDIIDNAFAVVDFAGGGRAVMDLCMFAENSQHEVEITATGERGKLQAFLPEDRFVVCYRDGRPHDITDLAVDPALSAAGAHHGATYYEHAAFLDAIHTGGKPAVTVEDGAWAVAVGAAAQRSIRERRGVELAELGF